MSVVRINAISVPTERAEELERRFAARAGEVSGSPGFEAFELLRPSDERDVYLVYTRWRSEEDFNAWVSSPAFEHGHRAHATEGPVSSHSELWSFEVIQHEEASDRGTGTPDRSEPGPERPGAKRRERNQESAAG
ncbi:MAG: antibiotic biosynthesis monooxygenase [Acidimicrobiia bacterium]